MAVSSGYPAERVLAGHDGVEYLRFAAAIVAGDLGLVPLESRRCSPGWPLVVASLGWLLPIWASAAIWILATTALAPVLFGRLLVAMGFESAVTVRGAVALALVYPALAYYGAFALVDSLLVFVVVASLLFLARGWLLAAAVMAGYAALIRTPCVFLVVGIATAGVVQRRWLEAAICGAAGLLPLALWTIVARALWGATNTEAHGAGFGLPFSGLLAMEGVGIIRAAYLAATVAFFLITCGILIRNGLRADGKHPYAVGVAVYAALFVALHLCLKTLTYFGTTIPTWPYFDRYLVALWPVALAPWMGRLKWRVIALFSIVSIAMASLWGINYWRAVKADPGAVPGFRAEDSQLTESPGIL